MAQNACAFISEGLRRGEAVVVVATRAHWAQIVGRLAVQHDLDLVDVVMDGQLRQIDSDIILAGVLEDELPSGNLFDERVGSFVERTARGYGKVRIVTELADMLWQAGNPAGAIRLEELWNVLANRMRLSLLCMYRADEEGTKRYNSALRRIGSAHSLTAPWHSTGRVPKQTL